MSSTQNTSEVRVSGSPARGAKSAYAKSPAPVMTMAVVSIIATDRPSARSAMPSGGAQPPTTYTSASPSGHTRSAITAATARPSGMQASAMRAAYLPPPTIASTAAITGHITAATSQPPPGVVATAAAVPGSSIMTRAARPAHRAQPSGRAWPRRST